MRALGIDPGSRYLGFGLVDRSARRIDYVSAGVIRLDGKAPLADRLRQIYLELGEVVRAARPDAVAVEGVFTQRNPRSALVLGHARGVALLVAAQASVPVFEYAPARVKRAVGAGGNDSKGSVARMVTRHLGLVAPLERADAYDALAVAICHLHCVGPLGAPAPSGGARGSTGRSFESRLRPAVVKAVAR